MGILKDLETFILTPSLLAEAGCPSASLALLTPGGQISSHVIRAQGSRGPAADPDTLYQACSVSKAIAGLGVARLVDSGALDYDTKVAPLIPAGILAAIVDPRTEHLMELVTVGMLLSHTAGLSQHGFMGYPVGGFGGNGKGVGGGSAYASPAASGATASATSTPGGGGGGGGEEEWLPGYEEIFSGSGRANHPRVRFLSFPGSQACYSGGGYVLLQIFLEELTGESFPALMQRLVFGPLGMTRSRYGGLAEGETNYARAHWTATHPGCAGERGYWRLPEEAAAGLWTTPSDLLRAVMAVQGSLDRPSSGGFLTAATARRMLELPAVSRAGDPDMRIAMGWMVDDYFFAHSGENFPGYVSYVFGSRGEVMSRAASPSPSFWKDGTQAGTGMAVMINSDAGFDTIERIVAAIFAFKGWFRDRTLPGLGDFEEIVPFPAPEQVYMPPEFTSELLGKWEGGWEVLDDDRGGLEVVFGDVLVPMSLRGGAMAHRLLDGTSQFFMVVDGLDIALTLTTDPETNERMLTIVQEKVTKVRRLAPATWGMDRGQHEGAAWEDNVS